MDMITANFNAMKFFDPDLVLGCETWRQLIGQFTDLEFLVNAKNFREACLGHLNLKQLSQIMLCLLSRLYQLLRDHFRSITRTGNEELVIEMTQDTMMAGYQQVDQLLPPEMRSLWRLTAISIEPLGTSTAFIRKNYHTEKVDQVDQVEIKCVDKDFYAQAYKAYTHQPVVPFDLKAMKDNYLITYEDRWVFE